MPSWRGQWVDILCVPCPTGHGLHYAVDLRLIERNEREHLWGDPIWIDRQIAGIFARYAAGLMMSILSVHRLYL